METNIITNPRKTFKKTLSFLMLGIFIYFGIMIAGVLGMTVVYAIVMTVAGIIRDGTPPTTDDLMEQFQNTDMGMGIGVLIGCVFMMIFFRKRMPVREIIAPKQKMKPHKFAMILVVLMGSQLVFTVFNNLAEMLFNLFGLSLQAGIEASTAGSKSISMMLYAGFLAPFAEELIYRGFTMHLLKKQCDSITGGAISSKGYAILISAFLFGVMHGNLTQSIFAFCVGFVFAYTAMEYGIIWSMLLHFMNNFVFGDVLVFVYDHIPETIGNILDLALFAAFTIGALIILIVKHKAVFAYIRENYKGHGKFYAWTFTNILFWLFTIMNLAFAVIGIEKLE